MDLPLNLKLLLNPVNWAIVVLMLVIAGFALHTVLPSEFAAQS